MSRASRSATGFTLVELMIAISVFSMVLILLTTGVLRFTRQYYKGVIDGKTQDVARAIMDDVTRSIQFNGGDVQELTANGLPSTSVPPNPVIGYCLGQAKRYRFYPNSQVTDQSPNASLHQHYHALVADEANGCNPAQIPVNWQDTNPLPALSKPREILGEHMRLSNFSIKGSGDLWTVTVRVVYGDDDLLCSLSQAGNCDKGVTAFPTKTTDLTCRSTAGSQFCAVTELSTTINKRIQ